MTAKDKSKSSKATVAPATDATPAPLIAPKHGTALDHGTASEHGTAILKQLGPSLAKRGVPETSYVMVNLANSEFVTGKTKVETEQRFASLHPGAEGWMQLVGDVIGVSLATRESDDAAEAGEAADNDAPTTGRPASTSSSTRWNGRRGPSRG